MIDLWTAITEMHIEKHIGVVPHKSMSLGDGQLIFRFSALSRSYFDESGDGKIKKIVCPKAFYYQTKTGPIPYQRRALLANLSFVSTNNKV